MVGRNGSDWSIFSGWFTGKTEASSSKTLSSDVAMSTKELAVVNCLAILRFET